MCYNFKDMCYNFKNIILETWKLIQQVDIIENNYIDLSDDDT